MGRSPLRQLLAELKRRRVYRVAAVYVVVAWILLQLGNIVVEPLSLPEWTMPLMIVLLVGGFPVAVVLGWAFDITPEGVRRTTPIAPAAPEGASAPAGHRVRSAAFLALGMLIAVLAIGTWAFLGGGRGAPPAAEADEVEEFHSLAVLPFTNTSPDPDNEFFADGVTEDILTHLAMVPDFAVVNRATVMRYKESPLSVREIAAELGVRYALVGSVRRAGDQVRITAQLVDGRTDQNLWVESYDRRLEDIFRVQTEIAVAISGALEAELSRGVAARIERAPTDDLEAYDLFLRAREDYHLYTQEGTERAMEGFRAALEQDPGFTLARAWLARAYTNYHQAHRQPRAWSDSALVQARRAVEEAPDLAMAQLALAGPLSGLGRHDEAEAALERAIALNPNASSAIADMGLLYARRGRIDEAIRLTRESLRREGTTGAQVAYTLLAVFYGQLGLLDKTEASLARAVELGDSDGPSVLFLQGMLHVARGQNAEAAAWAERLEALAPGSPDASLSAAGIYGALRDAGKTAELVRPVYEMAPDASSGVHFAGVLYGWALGAMGRHDEAERVLARTEEAFLARIATGGRDWGPRKGLATVHALRGETDEALRRLDEAVRLGWHFTPMFEWEPALDALRGDPRFQEIEARAGARERELRERVIREGW
jgi:adenylate cyclase